MNPTCLVSTVWAGGGCVMVWGLISWCTLGFTIPTEYASNGTAYPGTVADHSHPFMGRIYPF